MQKKSLHSVKEDVQKALRDLQSIGMAESFTNSEGILIWRTSSRHIIVKDKLGDTALKAYHNSCLEEAKQAQNLPVDTRRYRSLLLPLDESEFQNLNGEIDAFSKQLLAKYQNDKYQNRRLYKLNLNYFPVAHPLNEEDLSLADPV